MTIDVAIWRYLGIAFVLWLGALLGACTPISQASSETFRYLLTRHADRFVEPDADTVAATPYFQLHAVTKDNSAILILGNVDAGREAWYGNDGDIVFLHYGLVVKTWKLGTDIDATHLPADSPFITGLQHLQHPTETQRVIDLSDYRYGLVAQSLLTPHTTEAVEILGTTHKLLRVDEHLSVPQLKFETNNRYWVDPDSGFIWKSQQTIPDGRTLSLTALRPYLPQEGAPDA